MSEIELKPCPFCGERAGIERYGNKRQSTIYQCTNCACRLETGEEWSYGDGWNSRAVEYDLLAACEMALNDACKLSEETNIVLRLTIAKAKAVQRNQSLTREEELQEALDWR